MTSIQDGDGLQVDHEANNAAKAPELYQQQPAYNGYQAEFQRETPPWGLSIWKFGMLVAVVTAIIIGGAVGGGLGAVLADFADACPPPSDQHPAAPAETSACSSSNSNDTSSEADATVLYEPTPAKNVQNVTLEECQEAGAVKTKTMDGYLFEYYCGMDAGYNPDRYPDIKDIVPLIAYYFEDCLKACAQMNINNNIQDTNVTCDSVAFSRDMSRRTDGNGGNCWLKSGKWIRSKAEGDKPIPEMVYAVVIRAEE